MSWSFWQHRVGPIAVPAVIFLTTLGVYLRTMAPTVYNLDSAELATGAYTLAIVHPPGYPTYLLVGKLFTWLPVGDVGYRLNLMSGTFGALTVTCVYLIGRRLGYTTTAAATASLLLAFSYFFWTSSVVAEVYTLHALFLACLLLLLLSWREHHRRRTLLAFALLYGLSFGSHTSSALLAPGLAAFLLLHRDRRDAVVPTLVGMGCCFCLGLLVFAYLPIRYASGALNLTGWFDANGQYHTANLTTFEGLRWFISGELFRPMMLAYDFDGFVGEFARYVLWLWGTFTGLGIVLGAVGILEWIRTRPRDLVATGALFAGPLLFFVDYAAVDKETMFLVTYVVWSLWIGAGVDALRREIVAVAGSWSWRWRGAPVLVPALLLLMPVFALAVNYRYADVSWDRRSRVWATEILTATEPNAIVLGWWTDVQPMIYLQHVESVRPDVLVLSRLAIAPDNLVAFLDQRIGTTPVYSATLDPMLRARYDLEPVGRGYRLRPRATVASTAEELAGEVVDP